MSAPPQDSAPVPPGEVRAGFCAILGLPNVGKSTLLNRMVGKHLVAVSPKPQTTRNRIVGVANPELTDGRAQIAWVDTPGVQDGSSPLRKFMRDQALGAGADCDCALLVVDATAKRAALPARLDEADAAGLADIARKVPT